MTTKSISNIKSSLATLQENLPGFRKYLKENYTDTMNTGQWGSENEYSPNGLLTCLNNVKDDIAFLVGNPESFILLSTYEERRDIHGYLSRIASDAGSANLYRNTPNIVDLLDNLKKLLHPYKLRTDKKRKIAFQQTITELTTQAEHLIQVLEAAREKEKAIDDIHSAISERSDSISRKEETISALLKQSKETKEELDGLQEELENVADEIRTLNTASSEAKVQIIAYKDEV